MLYLYKVNNKSRNTSLQYIGEVKPTEGFISFDIDSKLLDGSDFIVSTNKVNSDNIA